MTALDISPVMLIVGDAVIGSLKVAVIVTTFEPETKLSESVSVKVTVGVEDLTKYKNPFLIIPLEDLPITGCPIL
jgi:hypothetical protein|tara:strand:- start:19 stop:243 length:225 start_codon:yes stop_codon:yes gene_type:complete